MSFRSLHSGLVISIICHFDILGWPLTSSLRRGNQLRKFDLSSFLVKSRHSWVCLSAKNALFVLWYTNCQNAAEHLKVVCHWCILCTDVRVFNFRRMNTTFMVKRKSCVFYILCKTGLTSVSFFIFPFMWFTYLCSATASSIYS